MTGENMKSTKVLSISELNAVLSHTFKTELKVNSGSCVGYIVKLDRCMLPVTSVKSEVKGADLLAMLAKLIEWEQTIEEVRTGILEMIETQLQLPLRP